MDKKIIISRIDELMQEKGINKYQLKENAEVSSTIYQWRKNAARDKDRTPSLRSIEKICDFLGVTLAYFFSFSNAEQNNTRILEIANSLCDMSKEQLITVNVYECVTDLMRIRGRNALNTMFSRI